MKTQTKRFIVTGRVQGVFFRYTTQQQAVELGLTGWAKNRSDGSVEVIAHGSEAQIKALESYLWEGPRKAHVENVTGELITVNENLVDFTTG
jgi:acylphosphatase